MTSGTITLYNSRGNRIAQARYSYRYQYKNKLKYWKEYYGAERFKTYYYHMEPDVNDINQYHEPIRNRI